MKQIVIMPGGFHPFHAGHYALYKSALEAFPQADVYVAATNDQSERPFPFSIKEKLAKLAGVAPGRFVQVKSPFQAKEITQNYNPEEDVLIFVRSEKDRNEQPKPGGTKKDGTPAYFQPWTGKNLQPFSKHAYMAYLPTVTFGPGIKSATEIRNAWPKLNDKQKMAMVMSLYPSTQKNVPLAKNVAGMFDQIMGAQGLEEGEREALQFATKAHAGQKRSGGEPYIAHPVRVADHVRNFKQSHNLDALISAAYLHDTVEDTDTTHEALHDLFGGLVASLVKELTSDPEEIKKVGKAQYLAHKMAAMSSYALVIKLADRLDNVKDITTARTPLWRQKYKNETEHILNYIEKTRALSGTHQKLIGLIREKLKELDDQKSTDEKEGMTISEDSGNKIADEIVNLYKPVISKVEKEKLPDYVDQARELLSKSDDPTIRKKLVDIFKTGKENPYLQGGIITTVGALLAGGILNTSQSMGLTPQQTNIALQAILNTVIPTLVSRINGRNWKDTIKYTLASAGVGTGIATITESADYLEEK